MRTEVAIHGGTTTSTNYLTWTPSPAEIWLSNTEGATDPVRVRLRNQRPDVGGQVVISEATDFVASEELLLDLPPDGTHVPFLIAGKHPHASLADGDAAVEVVDASTDQPLSITQLMVRIRKDANLMTYGERDRFVSAFATFNGRGLGRFSVFRDMHRGISYYEAHGYPAFLSWHRAYLLDLERELQGIDPSVALPYWRFDRPAPNLFDVAFLGETDPFGTVTFAPSNPIQYWRTDSGDGITRDPLFDQHTDSALVISEQATLAYGSTYDDFSRMEGNPHGSAHTSFTGWIQNPATSPKDPVFFLLHCNVDRLWAKWQRENGRFDPSDVDAYPHQGQAGTASQTTRVGHNRLDTMWPWNGVVGTTGGQFDRPPTAPGGALTPSSIVAAPSVKPTVGEMLDWQGQIGPASGMGFDYDDVPY
ncbi:MAG: tyrosinase family protein [Acidobacteriota bacterium]